MHLMVERMSNVRRGDGEEEQTATTGATTAAAAGAAALPKARKSLTDSLSEEAKAAAAGGAAASSSVATVSALQRAPTADSAPQVETDKVTVEDWQDELDNVFQFEVRIVYICIHL